MSLMLSYQKAIRAARAAGREVEFSAVPSPAAGKSLLAERQRDALVASGLAEDLEALHGVASGNIINREQRASMVTKGMMVVTRSSRFFNGVSILLFLSCFMAVSS